jgi:uncharacterized membrane protein YgaE (UPF0421/DUF939 family)
MFGPTYDPTEVTGILVGGGIGLVAIICVIIFFVLRYRIKIEQIKADAMVRAEEVRAKNQLEIEKMLIEESHKTSNDKVKNNILHDESYDEDVMLKNRENERKRI